MKRRISLFLALATAAAATTASAQVTTRDHRTPKAPAPAPAAPDRPQHTVVIQTKVDSFSPQSGRPGDRVTIVGLGFSRQTSVLFGGRKARVTKSTPKAIEFVVPNLFQDAEIVLRKPGVASDLAVGNFKVIVDPVIRGMSPVSGAAGTRVELSGRGFQPGDSVAISGKVLALTEVTPERAVVVIPDGATSDYFNLSRATGEKARSPVRFRVLPTPPAIASFSPEGGPPGTTVRISGTGFTAKDRVFYGALTAKITGRGPGWVEIIVPPHAPKSLALMLRGPGGTVKSAKLFSLELPPVLASFAPNRGAPGLQVEIFGRNFRDGDFISLAGKRLPIVQIREKQISVTIPPGSQSGAFSVGRGSFQVTAASKFEVLNPPTLMAFMPTKGEAGGKVTLTGQYIGSAQVFYGARRIKVLEVKGDGQLVVQVPADARDEKFRVVTRGGQAEAANPYQVLAFAVVMDASPRSVLPGKTITVRGRNLDKADQFSLGGGPLDIERRDQRSAILRVPQAARTSELEWVSNGRRGGTAFKIEVLKAPVVSQFQPTAGAVGTTIIIRGENFGPRTRVFLGQTELKILKLSPNEVVVRVTAGASGKEHLFVEGFGERVRSGEMFEVKKAPVVLFALPGKVYPGAQIKVQGRFFSDSTEILIDKVRARVVKRDKDSLLIEVPANTLPGAYKLSAKTDAMSGTWRRPLVVLGYASIRAFQPGTAKWGQKVKIDGEGLSGTAKVYFGSIELPIVKRGPDGKHVFVVIPDSAKGTAFLEVEDQGKRARSSAQLTIAEPPPATIKVRDHRTDKDKTPPAPPPKPAGGAGGVKVDVKVKGGATIK